jgi:hypothetical protein
MFKVRLPSVKALSRRASTVTAAVVGVVAVSVAAYGWVSAQSSTGYGKVSTGEALSAVDITGPSPIVLTLDQPFDLSGLIVNENTFRVSIAKIKVTVTSIQPPTPACSIASGVNFFLTDAVPSAGPFFIADGRSALGNAGVGAWQGGKIEFRSSPTFDQTVCLNKTITLRYKAVAA